MSVQSSSFSCVTQHHLSLLPSSVVVYGKVKEELEVVVESGGGRGHLRMVAPARSTTSAYRLTGRRV